MKTRSSFISNLRDATRRIQTFMPMTTKDRMRMRSDAHALEPLVHVGNSGVTDAVVQATNTALHDHELIKVRLGKNCEDDRGELANGLATQCQAELIQAIGRIVVLYKKRPDEPKKPAKKP